MALALTSMSPTGGDARGGTRLQIFGAFTSEFGRVYAVHIGPNGDATDPKAYSGRIGEATAIGVRSRAVLECFTPPLAPGIHSIYLERDDAGETGLFNNALVVGPNQYFSTVYGMRGVWAPHIAVGNRKLALESPPVADPAVAPSNPTRDPVSAGDTEVTGTAGNDLGQVLVYVNGVVASEGVVLGGVWAVSVAPIPVGASVQAQIVTVGGVSGLVG